MWFLADLALFYIILAPYILLSPLMGMPFYRHLLFLPSQDGMYDIEQVRDVAKEDVYFRTQNGKQLHGWYWQPRDARATVLLSHGNGGNVTHRLPAIAVLNSLGLAVFVYDYQGYGLSEGYPTIDGCCQDGLAAYDYLTRERSIPPEKIILYGESLGGGIACHIAEHRQSKAIILQSTFSSLPSIARRSMLFFNIYPDHLFPANAFYNDRALKKPHAPLLIVHGERDEVVPIQESQILFQAASQPKRLVHIEQGGHSDLFCNHTLRMRDVIGDFVDGLLPAAEKPGLAAQEV